MASLEEHRKAIQKVIDDAAADNCYLDDGDGYPIPALEINEIIGDTNVGWLELTVPEYPI